MDIVSARLRRGDGRFFLGQCTLAGISSVELLRGTDHGVKAWSRRLQCRTQFASFFLHVVQSALGGPLVNSFRFSRFAAQTSVEAGQKKESSSSLFVVTVRTDCRFECEDNGCHRTI